MMTFTSRFGNRSGLIRRVPVSGVTLLLFASAVVLISVLVLFSYVTGVFDRQSDLEAVFQADLSQRSAVAMLRRDLTSGSISEFSSLPRYSMDEQTTVFRMLEMSSVSPEVITWEQLEGELLDAVPAGGHIFLVLRRGTDIEIEAASWMEPSYLVPVAGLPGWGEGRDVSSAAAVCDGEPVLFVLGRAPGSDSLAMLAPDRERVVEGIEIPQWNDCRMLNAGCSRGAPSLILSSGGPRGMLCTPDSCVFEEVSSPWGTTPVFRSDGSIWGDISVPSSAPEGPEVNSILHGDYDRDGIEDMVFAGGGTMVFVHGAGGGILIDTIPEASLTAWGTVDESGLLAARWVLDDGSERWRVLLDGSFAESPGPEMLPLKWEGRLTYSKGYVIGMLEGKVAVASEQTGLLSFAGPAEGSRICQLNGRGPDIIFLSPEALGVHMDPLDGEGLRLSLESLTTDGSGDILARGVWRLDLFGTGGERRVRVRRMG